MAPAEHASNGGGRVGRRRFRKRHAALFLGLLAVTPLAFVLRPGLFLWRTSKLDIDVSEPLQPGYVDDASRLNATPVRSVWHAPQDISQAESELAGVLADAREHGWKVAIAGARHSMGGQTIFRDGVGLDILPLAHMRLDEETNTIRVGAGALWRDVIAYLDARGRSVAVMQSNNSFTVGGSISVNCHGWQVGRPPIASTVRSFRMMLADGSIVRCSRDENAGLFSAALGGYGLFGVILEAELQVAPNRRYRLKRHLAPAEQLQTTWAAAAAAQAGTEMVYGRLNVTADRFLKDTIVYAWHIDSDSAEPIPALHGPEKIELRRQVFRGSAESEYGKQLRWRAELEWQPKLGGDRSTRNQLLNEGVEVFQNRTAATTDILHEYFVPRAAFNDFIVRMRSIIPAHRGNLLNVTVRSVETDNDTMLGYASGPIAALVLLFHQQRTAAADEAMQAMTRELIDAALAAGGSYYLPYRLHATAEQFRRAYPRADEFFALKRKYDPGELFQNEFYVKYGRPAEAAGAVQ
jgi:FAD/FMN-containing dehydrogenase